MESKEADKLQWVLQADKIAQSKGKARPEKAGMGGPLRGERRSERRKGMTVETLDHSPPAVTLERLPDGMALLWLRKNIRQTRPQDESAPGWECDLVVVRLDAEQAAQVTAESVQADFDTWWNYTPPMPEPYDPESRILALLADGIREGVNSV